MKPCISSLWSSAIFCMAMSAFGHDGEGKEHKVAVGKSGLTFDPPRISAKKGDTIVFTFYQNAHTVTQTHFKNPCSGMNPPADSFCTTSASPNNGSSTSGYPTTSVTSNGGSDSSAYPTSSNGTTSSATSNGGSDTSAYPTLSNGSSSASTYPTTSVTSNGNSDTSAYSTTAANGSSDTSANPKTSDDSNGDSNAAADADDDYPSFGDPSKKPTNSSATSKNPDSDEVKGGEDTVQPTQQTDITSPVSTYSPATGNSSVPASPASASTPTQCNCGSNGTAKSGSDYPTGSDSTSSQGSTKAPTCDAKCIEVDGICQVSSDCTLQSKSSPDTKCKMEDNKCKRCGEAAKSKRSVDEFSVESAVKMTRRTVDLSAKTNPQDSQRNGSQAGTLGLDSGIVNVEDSKKESGTSWKVTITDDSKPLWFISASLNECSSGMVFAVNAPDTGDKTYNAFVQAAKSSSCPIAYPSTPHLQGDGCKASEAPCGGVKKDGSSGASATSNTYPTANSGEGKTPAPETPTNSTPSAAPTADSASSSSSTPTVDTPSSLPSNPSTPNTTAAPNATNSTKTTEATNTADGKGSASSPASDGSHHGPHGMPTLALIVTLCASLIGLVTIIQ